MIIMGHRGLREQDGTSPMVGPASISSSHAGAILGGTEIAAPLEKSRL